MRLHLDIRAGLSHHPVDGAAVFAHAAATHLPTLQPSIEHSLSTHPTVGVRHTWAMRADANSTLLEQRLELETEETVLAAIVAHPNLPATSIPADVHARHAAAGSAWAMRPDTPKQDAISYISQLEHTELGKLTHALTLQIAHRQWMRIHPDVLDAWLERECSQALIRAWQQVDHRNSNSRWNTHRLITRRFSDILTIGRRMRNNPGYTLIETWWDSSDPRLHWWTAHPDFEKASNELGKQAVSLYGSIEGETLAQLLTECDIAPAVLLDLCATMFPANQTLATLRHTIWSLPEPERTPTYQWLDNRDHTPF